MRFLKAFSILLTIMLFSSILSCRDNRDSNSFRNGMVVTAHYLASEVGCQILKKGGNAFDAAIAVQFSLAVVYPRAGNIGGGGFAVIRTSTGECNTLDFREKAPGAAHKTMYLDSVGRVIEGLSKTGHLSVGVPGTVDGMVKLHEKYGCLPWEELLKPAIEFASQGVVLSHLEAQKLNDYQNQILEVNGAEKTNVYATNTQFEKGDTLVNSYLANALIQIQTQGRKGFYEGRIANLIVKEIQGNGGILSSQDLKDYQSVWRPALVGEYRNHKVISMPLPSSGGIALLQLLGGVENYDIKGFGFGSLEYIHLLVELERRVYADRATWLGDPDFYPVPVNTLLSKEYLSGRFSNISMNSKTNSDEIKAGEVDLIESFETTHFSIADKEGNAIAVTTTLNGNYGSKLVVDSAGFFLNNEMDDFSIKPGVANQFGLVGGKANEIKAGKRMLSSMSPTIIERDGELYLILGSPGGSTIITSVFQSIVNTIDFGMKPQETVNAPRFHSQWLPDKVYAEPEAISPEVQNKLERLGHVIVVQNKIGVMANIFVDESGAYIGIADTIRHRDAESVGY